MNKLLDFSTSSKRIHPILSIILSTVGFIALNLAFGLTMQKILSLTTLKYKKDFFSIALHNTIGMIFTFGPIALLLVLFIYKIEKIGISSVGFITRKPLPLFLKGGGIGFIMVSSVSVLMILFGQAQITNALSEYRTPTALAGFILLFLGRLVQSSTEEFIFRGWLLTNLSLKWGTGTGVLVSSILFGIIHIFTNPSLLAVINLSLYGIFLAYYALNEGSIWGACGWHTLWNWTEGCLLGISENGVDGKSGLFFNIHIKGDHWLTGGELGSNASILLTLVLVTGALIQLLIYNKSKKNIK